DVHEKTLLCKELGLGMQDTKEQVLVGLRSRDACVCLTAKEHMNEDEVLADLRRLERISESRIHMSPRGKKHNDCILRHRAAEKCNLQVVCKAQDLYGFGNTDTSTVRSIGTLEVDTEIDDVVCHEIKVIVVNDNALPVDMLVGRTWTEQDYIAYLRMGDELRIGYHKPSKEPLRVKETMVLPKRTVCWVTVETGKSEGPSETDKEMLLHVEHGRVKIPVLNDKDEDQQLLKESLFARAELLSESEELSPISVQRPFEPRLCVKQHPAVRHCNPRKGNPDAALDRPTRALDVLHGFTLGTGRPALSRHRRRASRRPTVTPGCECPPHLSGWSRLGLGEDILNLYRTFLDGCESSGAVASRPGGFLFSTVPLWILLVTLKDRRSVHAAAASVGFFGACARSEAAISFSIEHTCVLRILGLRVTYLAFHPRLVDTDKKGYAPPQTHSA
ncbi:hypothetical protein HPB47_016428, partial [Ixodes persulcatus]